MVLKNGILMENNNISIKTEKNGIIKYFKDGKVHREDGPAIEYPNGTKFWVIHGEYHRVDGPAIEFANGNKSWWINDKLHREGGPAIEYANGDKSWCINGQFIKYEKNDVQALENMR